MSFAYIWEYQVKQDQTEAFRRIYGPDGEWIRLFLLFSVTLPLRDTAPSWATLVLVGSI